jgi:hypothetical protein
MVTYLGDRAEALPHGLTVAELEAVARRAARFSRWSFPGFAERVDLARFALLEHVYTCEAQEPSSCDVVMVGIRAVDRQILANEGFYGVMLNRSAATHGMRMPRYFRYWTSVAAPTRSPEDQIVDTLALWQIWPRLAELDRGAILALARHCDYDLAAKELNITHKSFKNRIYRARRRFLRLWHEHEEPSGMWSRDFRLTRPRGYRTNSIASTITQRRRLRKKKLQRSAPVLRTETDHDRGTRQHSGVAAPQDLADRRVRDHHRCARRRLGLPA